MKLELSETIGRHVPLALVAALALQGASVVWWVSARDRDHFFLEQRVTSLESGLTREAGTQAQVTERLARIEERMNAQLAVLDRIEKQINAAHK